MKVRLHPPDRNEEGGCTYRRMRLPAAVAEREGIEVEITAKVPYERNLAGETRLAPEGAPGYIDADVVVFQRPAKRSVVERIAQFQARGTAVVVDVDDDLARLHPNHMGYWHFHPRTNPEVNWRWLAQACAQADLVTCTTPALARRYGGHGRVAVLPNCVTEAALSEPPLSDGRTVGWLAGAVGTHAGDLEVTHGGVAMALRDSGWKFLCACEPEAVQKGLALDETPEELCPEWMAPADFQREVGRLDIALVPLGLTAFNAAKSTLKGIEAAARGVPFLASPTPPYEKLAALGAGTLVPERARNWRSALRRLMESAELRRELGERGREVVREHFTIEREGWRWVEAWEGALSSRRGGLLVA